MKTFKLTLEQFMNEGKFAFVEVEDCIDISDAIDHCRREFPDYDVIQFQEIAGD